MAPKKNKSKQDINIKISGDVRGNIIVGDSNVVGQGAQKSDDIKSRFLVPFPHNPDFVGRDEELSSLHEMLQQKQSIVGIRPTVLVGLGGIGKTQLAVEYAHAHRDDYPSGVFWLNAINPLLIEFSDLAEKLEMSDRDTPRDKAARKVWDYLDAHPDALVIFDNVLEPSELNLPFSPDLVPANLRCRTLFTTRQRDFPRTFQPFEVKVLPEMSAMRLLLRARPEVLEEHHPEWGWARIVCAYLGWLPLALELAAAYLGAYPEVSIKGYLERLRTEGSLETVDESEVRAVDLPTRVEEILKAAAAGNLELKHQVAVSATLQTQWKRLDDDDARLLFRAAGQFPEASWIPIPRLGLLTGIDSEAKAGRPSPLNVMLKKLHAVSLIEELSDDRLRLHPLVQEFAARLAPAPAPASFRLEMAERVATEFNDLLRLQARVIRYGVDMALEDLRTALGFCIDKKETETYSRISKMERMLDRQAHNLRDWNAETQPAFFLQQLHNESFLLGFGDLKSRVEAALAELGQLYLCEKSITSRDVIGSMRTLRTLVGHAGWRRSVAMSADGRLAVSAWGDKTLKVWEVATGRELRTLTGHSDTVHGVALSADGRLAVSASHDKTLKVWDVGTGQELRTLKGHNDLNRVTLSANGQLAFSSLKDKTIKVWDVGTGRELHTLEGHGNTVWGLASSADGRLVISASEDWTLKVWDVVSGRELRTLKENSKVLGVALSSDGRLAVSALADATLRVWDVTTGRELHTLQGHSDDVDAVALSADGRLAVSASRDMTLKVWDVETGRELRTLTGHSSEVDDVALSADGRLAVSASTDKTFKVWDISDLLTNQPVPKTPARVTARSKDHDEFLRLKMFSKTFMNSVALSADGRLAVSATHGNMLKVWDVATGCELCILTGHSNSVKSVALSADGQLAVSASADKTLKVWDISALLNVGVTMGEAKYTYTFKGHSDYVGSVATSAVAISADGRLAVSTSRDETLKVWDVRRRRELLTLTGHSSEVDDVALSADGRLAISTSKENFSADYTLKVWDISALLDADVVRGEAIRTLQGHRDIVESMALSADGRLAVFALQDKTLKVWDVATGRELRTLTGHSERVTGIALRPDGQLVISASLDNTLKVWDVTLGRCIATLLVGAPLKCCAMSADGKIIAAGDVLGWVHFLELVGADELLAKDVKIEKSWLALNEEVGARSLRLPRWLKGLLGK